MKTTTLILWGRTSPSTPWLKLTNDASKAEMARRMKHGWEVQRVPVGQSPSKWDSRLFPNNLNTGCHAY